MQPFAITGFILLDIGMAQQKCLHSIHYVSRLLHVLRIRYVIFKNSKFICIEAPLSYLKKGENCFLISSSRAELLKL